MLGKYIYNIIRVTRKKYVVTEGEGNEEIF